MQFNIKKFRVIANKVHSEEESKAVFAKLTKVADKFLNVSLHMIGAIPEDKYMERAIRRRKPVVETYPNSKSAVALFDIARNVLQWPLKNHLPSSMSFYQEQLMHGYSDS